MTILQSDAPGLPTPRAMVGAMVDELTRFSLPLTKIDETTWSRRNGGTTYTVTGATMQDEELDTYVEVPSGKYARAALFYLCTWARITGGRELSIGQSYRSYLALLGLEWSGAANGREAIRQLELVAGSVFSVNTTEVQGGLTRKGSERVLLADKVDLWVSTGSEDEIHKGSIILTEAFSEMLKSAVPVPTPAWTHLLRRSKSALPLDIYLWLCARLYKITRESRISWKQLHEQFGSSTDLSDFKRKFRKALALVMEVYPEARIYEQKSISQRGGFSGYLLKPGSGSATESEFFSSADVSQALCASKGSRGAK